MSTLSNHHSATQPQDPATEHLLAQNKMLKEMLFGRYGVLSGVDTIEKNLATAVKAKHEDAPFPLDHQEAKLYHRASAAAYQHALEMISSNSIREMGYKLGCISLEVSDQAEAESPPTLST